MLCKTMWYPAILGSAEDCCSVCICLPVKRVPHLKTMFWAVWMSIYKILIYKKRCFARNIWSSFLKKPKQNIPVVCGGVLCPWEECKKGVNCHHHQNQLSLLIGSHVMLPRPPDAVEKTGSPQGGVTQKPRLCFWLMSKYHWEVDIYYKDTSPCKCKLKAWIRNPICIGWHESSLWKLLRRNQKGKAEALITIY